MIKTLKYTVGALLALFMFSGCVAVKTASLEKDTDAKKFITDKEKANVYLCRNELFGAAVGMDVKVDGKLAGETGSKTYFNWKLEPGKHEFTSEAENTSTVVLNTEAGKNYHLWQEVKMGILYARTKLQEVPKYIGEKCVMESKLLESQF